MDTSLAEPLLAAIALGYDGVSAAFKWATIQLNAFSAKAHVDHTNTENTRSVIMAFGDFDGGEFLVWENDWYSARPLPADSCDYGVDVCNRPFQFNPFRPHATAPCRGERRGAIFYHVGPALMAASSVRSRLSNLGFGLNGEPPAQEDEVMVPPTGGRPHATLIREALALHPTGQLSQSVSLAAMALEYERERHGPRNAPDSAMQSDKYRRVASALERCRIPGTPGQMADLLPRADGVVRLAGRAYVRFTVPFLPIRGVAWAPVPIGHLFEESYGIRAPRDLSSRLRFRIGNDVESGVVCDFDARFEAAVGIVDCLVFLLAPPTPVPEALPVPAHGQRAAQPVSELVREPFGDSEFQYEISVRLPTGDLVRWEVHASQTAYEAL